MYQEVTHEQGEAERNIDYSEFMRLIRTASLCLMEGWLFLPPLMRKDGVGR
jgi:hypothetical protein